MPVVIPDEVLREAGLSERDAVVEIACRLFDAGRLALWPAAKLAGLSRSEFEQALGARKIPIYRPTVQDLTDDLAALEQLRGQK
jgi:predicted HTH domain antitoxin